MVYVLTFVSFFAVFDSIEMEAYPALVVEKMLRALKLNSSEARLKFPRLLQIIEQYSEETLNIMTKEVGILESGRELSRN
jgi:DNA-dependent protein kinase catalytic subunit